MFPSVRRAALQQGQERARLARPTGSPGHSPDNAHRTPSPRRAASPRPPMRAELVGDSDSDGDFVSESSSLLRVRAGRSRRTAGATSGVASGLARMCGFGGRRSDGPTWRERLSYELDSSQLGRCWDLCDAVVNMCFVGTYIALITFARGRRAQDPPPPPPPQSLEDLDAVVSILLLVQWLPRLFISLDPARTAQTLFTAFSLVTTIPVIVSFSMQDRYKDSFLEGGAFVFLYPLRFWRLHLSISQCLRPGKNVLFRLSPVAHKAVNLGLSIFNTLFTVTAWVHICLYVFQRYYDLSFFDVFYTIA
ncbi:hypothetical protein HK105_208708, partial [Polyrhizophydium stewartii]